MSRVTDSSLDIWVSSTIPLHGNDFFDPQVLGGSSQFVTSSCRLSELIEVVPYSLNLPPALPQGNSYVVPNSEIY